MRKKDLNTTGVYKITNLVSGRIYVGSTANSFYERWRRHKIDLRANIHHCSKLQHAWNKYGEENFLFEILEECAREECVPREQHYIDTLNPFYNECRVAGSALGRKQSEAVKKFHSDRMKGNKIFQGRKHTEEAKQKISAANKGKAPWTKGVGLTKETIEKIAAANKGQKRSEEARRKMSEAKKGKPSWNKGLKGVNKAWNKGKAWSEESRRKMSESRYKYLSTLNKDAA